MNRLKRVQWLSVLAMVAAFVGLLLSFFISLTIVVAVVGVGVIAALLSLKE